MDTIFCKTHGTTRRALVCQHVADGLLGHQRVGFFWTTEDPENPHPDAWCSDCEKRVKATNGAWQGHALDHLQPKIICEQCYEVAKLFHSGENPSS